MAETGIACIAPKMTPEQVAWLAGLFEGEGTIYIHGDGRVCLRIAMTDEDVIRRCHELAGGTMTGPYKKKNSKWKPYWQWYLGNQFDVWERLTQMLPFLGERRRARALEGLELLNA